MECWSNAFIPLQHSLFGTWWGVCPERKPKDRFLARLASETFLTGLGTEIFRHLLPTGMGQARCQLVRFAGVREVSVMMGSKLELRLQETGRV